MTIAVCYLSPEGVVLGADSTTTMYVANSTHGVQRQFDFAQKVFQIGENGHLGITMWGLGNLDNLSYRTLIARFADELNANPASDIQEVATRWSDLFFSSYSNNFSALRNRLAQLTALPTRNPDEEKELQFLLHGFSGGFCIGGQCMSNRTPRAFEVTYSLDLITAPIPVEQQMSTSKFWGCPNLIHRLIFGIDDDVFGMIVTSPHWVGSQQDLFDLVFPHMLGQPQNLPIREAIDWVYSSIYSTIKSMKFSHMAPVCGGPIEIAVITTDRPFRWVKHKGLDIAFSNE